MKYIPNKLYNAKKRVWEIDFVRGIAIVLMCMDHLVFDLATMDLFFTRFNYGNETLISLMAFGRMIWHSDIRMLLHYVFAAAFLLMTGISCAFSKNNGKRVLQMIAVALVLSFATALLDSVMHMGAFIVFGVIHCMALALVLCLLLDKMPGDGIAHLIVGTAIIVVGICIKWYDAPWVIFRYNVDMSSAQSWENLLYIICGFVRGGGDHFGIFPSAGVVLVGAYIGKKFYREKRSLLPKLDGGWNKGYTFIGRNTVWVYLAHQIVIAGLVMIIGVALGSEVL